MGGGGVCRKTGSDGISPQSIASVDKNTLINTVHRCIMGDELNSTVPVGHFLFKEGHSLLKMCSYAIISCYSAAASPVYGEYM